MKDYSKIAVMIIIIVFLASFFEDKQIQKTEQKTRLDYIMKCQELAAMTNNEAWKYTDCLKAIDENLQTKGKLL